MSQPDNNDNSNESVCKQKQSIGQVNDIDSLLTGLDQQTFGELERQFQNDNRHAVRQTDIKDEARNSLSLFISKCQDIDEMIDPLCPMSPLSPNQVFNTTPFRKSFENIEEEEGSVAVEACQVKVHNSAAMKSTVIMK